MAYATNAEFLQRYDARVVGDLVKDDSTRLPPAELASSPVLTAMLEDASAAINSALFVGARYTTTQLASLSSTAASFLRRLACDHALIYLKRRRGTFGEKDQPLLEEVNRILKSLRDGEDLLLLGNQTQAAASTIELTGTQMVKVPKLRTVRNRTRNYYPNSQGDPNRGSQFFPYGGRNG